MHLIGVCPFKLIFTHQITPCVSHAPWLLDFVITGLSSGVLQEKRVGHPEGDMTSDRRKSFEARLRFNEVSLLQDKVGTAGAHFPQILAFIMQNVHVNYLLFYREVGHTDCSFAESPFPQI